MDGAYDTITTAPSGLRRDSATLAELAQGSPDDETPGQGSKRVATKTGAAPRHSGTPRAVATSPTPFAATSDRRDSPLPRLHSPRRVGGCDR